MTHDSTDLINAGKAVLMRRLDCTEALAEKLLIELCERTHESPDDVAHALLDPMSQEALIAVAAPWRHAARDAPPP